MGSLPCRQHRFTDAEQPLALTTFAAGRLRQRGLFIAVLFLLCMSWRVLFVVERRGDGRVSGGIMAARPGAAVLPCLCFLDREGLRNLGWGMENKNTGAVFERKIKRRSGIVNLRRENRRKRRKLFGKYSLLFWRGTVGEKTAFW